MLKAWYWFVACPAALTIVGLSLVAYAFNCLVKDNYLSLYLDDMAIKLAHYMDCLEHKSYN